MKVKTWTVAGLIGMIAPLIAFPSFAQSLVSPPSVQKVNSFEEAKKLQDQVKELIDDGDYETAISLADRALKILEQSFQNHREEFAVSLRHRGFLYEAQGNDDEAEKLYWYGLIVLNALKIKEGKPVIIHGKDTSTPLRQILYNLASLFDRQGKYLKAESLYVGAMNDIELGYLFTGKRAVSREPWIAVRSRLVMLYARLGKLDKVINLLSDARTEAHMLHSALLLGYPTTARPSSRYNGTAMYSLLMQNWALIHLAVNSAPKNLAATKLASIDTLRFQGSTLSAAANSVQTVCQQENSSEIRQLCNQWKEASTKWSNLVFRGQLSSSTKSYEQEFRGLEEQIEDLEAEFRQRVAVQQGISEKDDKLTLESIKLRIPKNAALIQIVEYRPLKQQQRFQDSWVEDWHYAALILSSVGDPRWLNLGKADVIDASVVRLRNALADQDAAQKRNVAKVQQASRLFDQQVMAKIRPLLGDAKHLLISADGELNLVPFEALQDETGQYLINRYQFSYLTSGRDLLKIAEFRKNRQKPQQEAVIVADPDYDQPGTQVAKVPPNSQLSSNINTAGVDSLDKFYRAPGTVQLAQALKSDIIPNAKLLTNATATKTALRQFQSPRILVLATHGFFLPNQEKVLDDPRQTRLVGSGRNQGTQPQILKIENPLMRSGLALAGINRHNDLNLPLDADNGILTALEVAGLDLRGTQLAVLSACETGVGEAKVGDGVYGLRRALLIAGAQSQVLSLWKVDDTATKDLMVNYFRKMVKQGKGRHTALQEAKQEMMMNPQYQHPYYWASFIPSGDWTPLSK